MITIPTYLFIWRKGTFVGTCAPFWNIFPKIILVQYNKTWWKWCRIRTSVYKVYIWVLFRIMFGKEKEAVDNYGSHVHFWHLNNVMFTVRKSVLPCLFCMKGYFHVSENIHVYNILINILTIWIGIKIN